MPNVQVTPELGKTIKSERTSRNIKASYLADKIGKSISYFSNIENAKVEKIDLNILYTIFENIIEENEIKSYMSNLLQKVTIGLTEKEIKHEEWMHTFDIQYREIPIPEEIYDYINDKLQNREILSSDIIKRLNENEGLENPEQYKVKNKVYASFDNDGIMTAAIKFDLPDNFLDKLLNRKMDTINYINMLGIIYTLFRSDGFSDEESKERAGKFLYENKFYTLLEKNRLLRAASKDAQIDIESALSPEDKKYLSLSKEITRRFNILSDKDVKYTNSKLEVFCDNIKNEPSITFAIIGLPIAKLKGTNKETKKQFIQDVKALIDKYSKEEESDIELID